MKETELKLTKTESCYTHDPESAFQVLEGSVYVYLVPWDEKTGQGGKRVLLGEVDAEHTVPAYAWRDPQYRQWRFLLTAKTDQAVLRILPEASTQVLKRKFLRSVGIDTYEMEGYEASLAEFYAANTLADDVFLQRSGKRAPEDRKQSLRAMAEAVVGEIPGKGGESGDLYGTLAFACRKAGIDLAERSWLEERCTELSLPEMARVSRFICREVVLDVGWFRSDCGVLLGTMEGRPAVLYPQGEGYRVYDAETGQDRKLTSALLAAIHPKAWSIRRALPSRALTRKDIIEFVRRSFHGRELLSLAALSLCGTLIGVLIPKLNQLVYDDYIAMGEIGVVLQVCLVIASFMLGNVLISVVRQLQEYRIPCRAGYELQDAVYWRLFLLPEDFFRKYDSADLAERIMGIGSLVSDIIGKILSNGLSLILGLIYLVQMFHYSSKLALACILMTGIYGGVLYLLSLRTIPSQARMAEYSGEAAGKLYQYLGGIDKIRMAGAEERAILEYTLPVANEKREDIRSDRISALTGVLSGSGATLFSMVLYYMMVKGKLNLTVGSFMAFNTAFGAFTGAVLGSVSAVSEYMQTRPALKRIAPVLTSATEDDGTLAHVDRLDGDIRMEHVWFGYRPDSPVLKDLNLHIRAGEYVALVGPSGCGKSTVLKLLLGFEKPDRGKICYDGRDLAGLDRHSLRSGIGAVLQNGQLIAGSIYENITISSRSKPSVKDVMQTVEDVGLKEDIEAMPMGIHTILNESGGTISGGQRQRILIARAIFSNPPILYFDEATSALDNLTQAKVCESLGKRHMTRLVIAHRLSTVQNCDRILVLDQGRIVEEGDFRTLMERRGMFYQMAVRQIAE